MSGESLRENEIRNFSCGLLVVIVGLGLYSYFVRELLAALTLFGIAVFFLALLGLGSFLAWCAGAHVAIWARPASRNAIVFSRRLIAAYVRP